MTKKNKPESPMETLERLKNAKPKKEISGKHKPTGLDTFTYEGKNAPVFLVLNKTTNSRSFIELTRFEAMTKKEQDDLIKQYKK